MMRLVGISMQIAECLGIKVSDPDRFSGARDDDGLTSRKEKARKWGEAILRDERVSPDEKFPVTRLEPRMLQCQG